MATARALVLSNWEYSDPSGTYKPLLGPRSNLVEVERALTHPDFGLFTDVTTHENLTSSQIGERLFSFLEAAEPGDTLLIYYSGHGERLSEQQQLGLCGIDVTETTVETRCFDTMKLSGWLRNRCRAKGTVIVLDCCYSGQYMSGADAPELLASFGEGVAVLTSGGNVPVRDTQEADQPSPFTKAFVDLLVDESTPHTGGLVTPENLYDALLGYRPTLQPRPQRKVDGQGALAVARRPVPVAGGTDLKGWVDRDFETVEVRFSGTTVTSSWSGHNVQRDLGMLDRPRLLAIRRLLQLLDVVVGSADLRQESFSYPVRRAWQCIGMNLLEHALPEELKQRLVAGLDGGGATLRVRLHFDDASELARYPWEYICGEMPSTDERRDPPLPLGLRNGILIERVGREPNPGVHRPRDEGGARQGQPSRRAGSATAALTRTTVRAPQFGRPESRSGSAAEPASVIRSTTVGLVNGFPRRFAPLGERLAAELDALSTTDVVFDLGEQAKERADWATFTDSMDQRPKYLVLLLPTKRERGELWLGFADEPRRPDWRSAREVVQLLKPMSELELVVLGTVAAAPSSDAFRGNIETAEYLCTPLQRPVLFLCHTPGFEEVVAPGNEDLRPMTFTGLLLHALSMDKDPEQAFVYARDRVVLHMPDRLRPLFGVPGYYLPATLADELSSTLGDSTEESSS